MKAVAEDIERLDRIQAQLAAEHELREWQRKHQHLADYRDVIARVLGEDE